MKRRSLKSNTIYLYILTASNYLLGFITVPYQTRVLGPDAFGIIGFAIAVSTYFNLIFDFGFLISGTKSINEASEKNISLSKIFSSITLSKLILFFVSTIFFLLLCTTIELFRENFLILSLYIVLALCNSLLPDYIYRGLEDMKKLTIRTVLTRSVFTLLIFIYMKSPNQYYYVPLFQIIGSVGAILWTYYDITTNLNIRFEKVNLKEIYYSIKESSLYFISRIATTIYNGTNTILLGFLYSDFVIGLYTSGTKFRELFNMAENPLCDSIYPYMTRTKNFKKLIYITAIIEVPIIVSSIFLWVFAEKICVLIFGPEYSNAADIVRLTIPLIIVGFPGKMFGFPALTPLGKQRWANLSNVYAMINQLILISILWGLNMITVKNLLIATIISESLGVGIRLFVFIKAYYNEPIIK